MDNELQELAGEFGASVPPTADPVEQAAPQPAAQEHQETAEQAESRNGGNRIPLSEHLSVRERAQAAERERDDLRRQLQQYQSQKPAEKPADWDWEKPEQFVTARAQEIARQTSDPIMASMMFNSRLVAHQVHGAEIAQKAEDAFNEAIAKGEMDPATHARINGSPNPFHAAVEWYRQREVLQKVGGDLSAYEERLLEEKLKDPDFLAKAVAANQAAQQARASNGQFVKPTNVTRLPPSLNRTAGASSMPTGDVSDEDMARAFGAR